MIADAVALGAAFVAAVALGFPSCCDLVLAAALALALFDLGLAAVLALALDIRNHGGRTGCAQAVHSHSWPGQSAQNRRGRLSFIICACVSGT